MRVLLLGATGLLGHNVLQQLVACGYEVVVLARRRPLTMPAGAMLVEGEITCRADVERAATIGGSRDGEECTGEVCDAIVNCAGVTDMSLPRRRDYEAVNHELCQVLVETMEGLGISRLVHTSTVNTIGYGSEDRPANESEPMRSPFDASYYAVSKQAGERVVMEAARRHPEWHVVVVNSGFMLGAWDVKPSSGRMLLAAWQRRLMAAPPGGKSFVAVNDVAAAVVAALTRGVNGERYIVAGQSMTVKELYELQASTMGYRQRVLTLPRWLMMTAGMLGDGLRACGVRTELCSVNVRQLMVREHYDGSRAVRELGIAYTSIDKAIKEFYQWREQQKER